MSTFDALDRTYMARALALAAKGLASAHPNPRVGSVFVRDGREGCKPAGTYSMCPYIYADRLGPE